MSDNSAVLEGFTIEVEADNEHETLYLLVKPNTVLSGRFRAWNMDLQEFVNVDGSKYRIVPK